MPGNYQSLLTAAAAAHSAAQQKVRGPTSAKRIADAVAASAGPFADLANTYAVSRTRGGSGDTALLAALRTLESKRAGLQSAVERAQSDDDTVVRGIVVEQAKARALADKQKAADEQFLTKVDEILDIVREDMANPNGLLRG